MVLVEVSDASCSPVGLVAAAHARLVVVKTTLVIEKERPVSDLSMYQHLSPIEDLRLTEVFDAEEV